MPMHEHVTLVQRYFAECLNSSGGPHTDHGLAVLDELMTEDFVMYFNNQSEAAASHGLDAHKTFIRRHAENFTGACWMIETLLADKETIACQWRIQATHAPSGNPIDVRAADMYRLRDGRLAELRRFLDFRSLGEQAAASTARP